MDTVFAVHSDELSPHCIEPLRAWIDVFLSTQNTVD
jgi:hypothetical protein